MTEKTKKYIRRGVGIFLAVWTVLVGIAFIVQVLRIYSFGDKAFTPARIGEYFAQIAVPVYIWIAAVVAAIVLYWIFPAPKEKVVPYIELEYTLSKLNKRLPETSESAKKLQRNRLIAKCVCGVACVVCVVFALVYLIADYKLAASGGFLAKHPEAERILRALVWIVAATALSVGTVYYVQDTFRKEIHIAKSEIAANAKKGVKVENKEEKPSLKSILKKKFAFVSSGKFILGLRIGVAAVAVAFIVIGICNGGIASVLYKAINICTQCIGLG